MFAIIGLVAWAIGVLPFLYGPSQQAPQVQTQQQSNYGINDQKRSEHDGTAAIPKKECGNECQHGSEEGTEFWPPLLGYRLKVTDTLIALFTAGLFVATWFLYWATRDLVNSTIRIESRQSEETRILQRAYISVSPHGVEKIPNKPFYAFTVDIENVGHLPARKVLLFSASKFTQDRYFKDTKIDETGFEGEGNVIPPGTKIPQGGKWIEEGLFGVEMQRSPENFLYIWGEVRYHDGFERSRSTKFCYRYNLAAIRDGWLKPKTARQHIYGNDAN